MNRGKKPKRSESPTGSSRFGRRLVVVALTLAAAAGLVWGVARLGELARSGLGPRDRYAVRFADVRCDAPPRLDRAAFLAEVRYVSDFPETFQSLDPDSQAKLAAAFAARPGSAGHWDAFPLSVKRGILEWIVSAKKPETRANRVEQTASMAARNERANQWRT